jgi:hypothetical protein
MHNPLYDQAIQSIVRSYNRIQHAIILDLDLVQIYFNINSS